MMMRKTPTIFERDWDGDRSKVLDAPNPLCAWVFAGEGVATRKYDGTCCMFDGENWWKRREVKQGKTPPLGFREEAHDETTGKRVGWVLITDQDKWHHEGIANSGKGAEKGTFELCGPKVQGNPEGFDMHVMVSHDAAPQYDVFRAFEYLRQWLLAHEYEGLVFHHPDGRMAKIKKRDFA